MVSAPAGGSTCAGGRGARTLLTFLTSCYLGVRVLIPVIQRALPQCVQCVGYWEYIGRWEWISVLGGSGSEHQPIWKRVSAATGLFCLLIDVQTYLELQLFQVSRLHRQHSLRP